MFTNFLQWNLVEYCIPVFTTGLEKMGIKVKVCYQRVKLSQNVINFYIYHCKKWANNKSRFGRHSSGRHPGFMKAWDIHLPSMIVFRIRKKHLASFSGEILIFMSGNNNLPTDIIKSEVFRI